MGGCQPPGDAARRQEPAGADSTGGTASGRARRDLAGACESRDSEGSVSLLTELDAFFTEHRRCGGLDAGDVSDEVADALLDPALVERRISTSPGGSALARDPDDR